MPTESTSLTLLLWNEFHQKKLINARCKLKALKLRYSSLARRWWWNVGSLTCDDPRLFEAVQGGFLDYRTPQTNCLRSSKLWIPLAQLLSVKCQKLPSLVCFIWQHFISEILKCIVLYLENFICARNFTAKS